MVGDASMPGDDLVVPSNEYGIAETEALDQRRDLLDLSLAMTPRVTLVGPKRSDGKMFDRWREFSHVDTQKLRVSDPSKATLPACRPARTGSNVMEICSCCVLFQGLKLTL